MFHGDASVIGRTVRLGTELSTVVGVLPNAFRFQFPAMGSPTVGPGAVDVYAPLMLPPPSSTMAQLLNVVMRLVPNSTMDAGRAELEAISRARIGRRDFGRDTQLRVMPLHDRLVGEARVALRVLLGAVGFVVLIACVSLANLLLARASSRRTEIAIRFAIGAGRWRLFRQSCVECLVVTLFGWMGGLCVARVLIGMLVRLGHESVPRLTETSIDGRVLVGSLGTAVVVALLLGWTSASAPGSGSARDPLKDGGGTSGPPASGLRLRMLLVGVELAVAIVLLVGAGLMLKSFSQLYANPPGFEPGHVLTMSVDVPGPDFSGPADRQQAQAVRQRAYVATLLQQLESFPGVTGASITSHGESMLGRITVEGAPTPSADAHQPAVLLNATTSSFAKVMGLRLVTGRWIADDEPHAVVVLNQTLARRLFGSDNPLGRRIERAGTVIGVVADMGYAKLDERPRAELYVPYAQVPGIYRVNLVIRTTGDPLAAVPDIRRLVLDTDPSYAPYDVMTLEQELTRSILPRRFNFLLLGWFAATAFLVGLSGIYGVMAYAVVQRTHEIGLRIALGATHRDAIWLVMRQGALVTATGVGVGLAGALGLMRQMAGLLYEVRPLDPSTLLIVSRFVVATALTAGVGPALRAAYVEPVVVLRHE
jgi:putative ABC transport system permease protein